MLITPLGDMALQVQLGETIDEPTHKRVQTAWRALAGGAVARCHRGRAGLCDGDGLL
jgi:hypothetical protein